MAARVNTRFLLILLVTIVAVGGLLGGLWVLQKRNDTTRHVSLGDQLMAAGEFEEAMQAYGRAVSKQPGNLEHLSKYEAALLKLEPKDREEARDLYQRRLQILQHRIRYHGGQAEHHLALLRELLYPARLTNAEVLFHQIRDAATQMWEDASPSDPAREEANLYMGLAGLRLIRVEAPEEIATPVERLGILGELRPEDDVLKYLEKSPTSDLGWATLVVGQFAAAERLRTEGNEARHQQWMAKAEASARRAMEAVPEGPEVARVAALYQGLRQSIAPESVSDAEVTAAVDRMMELVGREENPALVYDAAELLRSLQRREYSQRGIALLQRYVDAHPDAHFHRTVLAQFQLLGGDLDQAQANADIVRSAEVLPVTFLSRYQDQLEKRCSAMLVDVAYRRWEAADDEHSPQREALLGKLEQAMRDFEAHVTDTENDPLYILAQGKLALAHRDYPAAAKNFDRLRRSTTIPGAEVLVFAAKALEETGALGIAYECVQQLNETYPRTPQYLYECARLAYRLKRAEAAQEWLAKLLKEEPEHALGHQLGQLLILEEMGGDAPGDANPITQAIMHANEELRQGDADTAALTLEQALATHPDNLQLLDALLQVEVSRGNAPKARELVTRLLELQPDNPRIKQMKVVLTEDDPFQAIAEYVAGLEELDEGGRAVEMLLNHAALAAAQRVAAQRLAAAGRTDDAAAALAKAERGDAEAARWETEAMRLAPDDPQLIEYRLRRVTAAGDWAAADALLQEARRTNADQAGGALFAGQLAATRGNFEQALIQLDEAVQKIPHSPVAWRSLAMVCERVGNFVRAKDAYAKAYNSNPNDIETIVRYVSLLVRVGDDTRALLVLRRARQLVPGSIPIRELWLDQEYKGGDRAMVLKLRRQMHAEDPSDRVNAEALATFLARTEPDRPFILDEKGEPAYPETRWARMITTQKQQIIDEERKRWHAECDALVAALRAGAGPSLETSVLQATLLRERGEVIAGERVLLDLVNAGNPPDVEAVLALGRYQFNVGRRDEAAATMRQAIALQDPVRRQADMALGDMYFMAGEYEQALDSLQRITAVDRDHDAALRVIECLMRLERFKEAEQLLTARMGGGRNGFQEQLLLASLADAWSHELLLDGEEAQALPLLAQRDGAITRAEQLMPSSPEPHVQRAVALMRRLQRELVSVPASGLEEFLRQSTLPDDALRSLARADEARQGDLQTGLTRVRVLTMRGDVDGAIGELKRLLEAYPDDTASRDRLARLQYGQGDLEGALATIDRGLARNATFAPWHELKGDLYISELEKRRSAGQQVGDLARQSVAAYRESVSFRADPAQVAKLARAYQELEPPDYQAVIKLLGSAEQQLNADPSLRNVLALALHRAGQKDPALKQMRTAFEQYKSGSPVANWEAMSTIGYWYRTMQQILERPQAVESYVMDLTNQRPDWIDLRWLARCWASQREAGMSRALELHQKAMDSHAGRDSQVEAELHYDLARYYLLSQQVPQAAEALKRVLDSDPHHKQALNNLAYLLATVLGRPQEAMPLVDRLERLINLRDSREDQAAFLDTIGWVYWLNGHKDRAEEYLRRSRGTHETPSCLVHLARILADRTDYRAAEAHLQRAAELNPDPDTAKEIEALWDDIRTRQGRTK